MESENVVELFAAVWADYEGEQALEQLFVRLREKWQQYKAEKTMLLFMRAFLEEDEGKKAVLETEIDDRGLGEDYMAAVDIWVNDGVDLIEV